MSILYITMGISGSGKSRLAESMEGKGAIRINPDLIRKELTGNISDQSKNNEVFRLAHKRTAEALATGSQVVFDAINTRAKSRKELIKIAKENGAEVVLMVLMDSKDKNLCASRVRKDLDAGVDRSDTLVEEKILNRQHNAFMESLKNIENETYQGVLEVGGL